MKKIITLFLLLILINANSQQKLNWGDVLFGDFKNLKANNIKTLKLKKGSKVIRQIEVNREKFQITTKDSLETNYFVFDSDNRLTFLNSISNDNSQKFELKYQNGMISWFSHMIDNVDLKEYKRISNVFFQNHMYQERENYNIDKKKNDSTDVWKIKYFFNEKNPDLSYEEINEKDDHRVKRYFNQTEVSIQKFPNYYTVDSLVYVNGKIENYGFSNYNDEQKIVIKKDSVYTINKKFSKKVSERTEFGNVIFKEIFYDENEKITKRINYINYKNLSGKFINWEKETYNAKGNLIKREFPNKKIYKLKRGILYFRKSVDTQVDFGLGNYMAIDKVRNKNFYNLSLYSTSILFVSKLGKRFSDNFDISLFDDIDETVYTNIAFNDKPSIMFNSCNSYEIQSEIIRTSKIINKRKIILSYFKDLEIEAETSNSKKYTLKISQNPELLSLSIHLFLFDD